MPLNSKQKSLLRSLSHNLKPVVMIGAAGLTEGVLSEIDSSISLHELIKVKVNASDRLERKKIAAKISESTDSEIIQLLGSTLTIYRAAKPPVLKI